MRKLRVILLAGLLIAAVAAPASAWEFGLTGRWLWGYDYVDQAGRAGFFGPYDVAFSPGLTAAGGVKWNAMNAWVGARTINGIQYGMVTGADASLQWMRMELDPEIRLNKAIRFRGEYQIGAGALTEYGLYANSSAFGAWNPIAAGQWTQWWMTAQTPWGILLAGKRPFAWGMGAQYDGTSCTSESFGVVAPYGPLRIGVVIYPWRGQTWVNSLAARDVISTTLLQGPQITPFANIDQTRFFDTANLLMNYRLWDNDRKRQLQPAAFVTYDAGDVSAGIVYEWFSIHNGPGGARFNGDDPFFILASAVARTFDEVLEDGSAYFKYNSGRFFLNMELAWVRGQLHVQPSLFDLRVPLDFLDGRGSRLKPYYLESWKWMMELGAMAGPAKLSFLWSWVPGPDRRAGVWIGKQSWENVVNGSFFGNEQPFLPYSLLMGYQYGAGLLALNRNGEGYMTDANSYGARLDYAVAANLNLYGSFFYATRVSGGWPWGVLSLANDGNNGGGRVVLLGQQIGPIGSAGAGAALAGTMILNAPQNGNSSEFGGGNGNFAPNIPDDSLGWEATAGLDWKLLEGLTVRLRGAYWEVGNWFKFACIDKTVAEGAAGGFVGIPYILPQQAYGAARGLSWGVNPARSIDPIWMFQGVMVVDF